MRACREGGASIETALRQLDRAFFAPLYREGVRMLRDADLARDVVQETFIKVWQRCALFQGQSELLAWIRVILRNGVLDRLRRAEREVTFDERGEMTPEVAERITALAGTVPTPDDETRRLQLAECFERCWAQFEAAAPAHATVLTWIIEDGLANEEVGAILGRTPGATREFLSQCRKRAREHLAEWHALAVDQGVARERA